MSVNTLFKPDSDLWYNFLIFTLLVPSIVPFLGLTSKHWCCNWWKRTIARACLPSRITGHLKSLLLGLEYHWNTRLPQILFLKKRCFKLCCGNLLLASCSHSSHTWTESSKKCVIRIGTCLFSLTFPRFLYRNSKQHAKLSRTLVRPCLPFIVTSIKLTRCIESHSLQNNPFLLPTVTSFIPGLPAGTAFRISIHSWQNPEISRYTQSLSKPSDVSIFEARLLVDGRVTG